MFVCARCARTRAHTHIYILLTNGNNNFDVSAYRDRVVANRRSRSKGGPESFEKIQSAFARTRLCLQRRILIHGSSTSSV